MAQFVVSGPHLVPLYKGKSGRTLRSEEAKAFFAKHQSLAAKRGCYVFAMRSGGGITPVYVGKATKSFAQEIFGAHKLSKCNEALVDYEKGSLVVFMVEAPSGKRAPAKQIALLEDFLIQTGVAVNENLLNIKGTKQAEWSIRGVIRASSKGRPSRAVSDFKKAFDID
jgi:hypothetical protein